MKLFSLLTVGSMAIPQRYLSPGLRERDSVTGDFKRFVTDDGYSATTNYDFEANKNPNAKPINPIWTSTMLNILCRNTPTDELCANGLRGVFGNFEENTAKLYNIGKTANDVATPIATSDDRDLIKNFWADTNNFSNSQLFKYLAYAKGLRKNYGGPEPDWRPEQNGAIPYNPLLESQTLRDQIIFGSAAPQVKDPTWISNFMTTWKIDFDQMFSPLYVRGQKFEVMSYFLWNKVCLSRDDVFCRTHNGVMKIYTNYLDDVKTALDRIF